MWSDSYYPYISGVTRSLATLRKAFLYMGHEVYLYCPRYPGVKDEDKRITRFPSFPAPTNRSYRIAIPTMPGLLAQVKETSPDVIHVHSPFNLGKKGFTVGKRLGIPVVLTYHTMYNMYAHYVPLLGSRVSGLVESLALSVASRCDLVVTPTETIRDYLLDKGVKTQCVAIPNGIDLKPFQKGDGLWARRAFGIAENTPLVVTSGRLGKEKNLEVLFKAYSHTLTHIESMLLVVGDGPLKEHLKALASELGAERNIVFTGSVRPDLMPHIYAAGDIFLFASLTDTQGLVLAEAKASGLPTVAVGAMGVKDMVRDCVDGYLCKNDPEEIGEKVAFLLTHEDERKAMSQRAKALSARFSSEHQAKKLLEAYLQLGQGH